MLHVRRSVAIAACCLAVAAGAGCTPDTGSGPVTTSTGVLPPSTIGPATTTPGSIPGSTIAPPNS